MKKAVIFDMFETLVSMFAVKTYFGDDMADDIDSDREAFLKAWRSTESGRTTGRYTIEEGIRIALDAAGIHDAAAAEMLIGKRNRFLDDTFAAVPDKTCELLSELRRRGLKIGLISNCYSNESVKIRESALFQYFDAAMLSYEQGICKPDPEIFRRMTRELAVAPEECLYVGDGESGELFAARDAGMKPVQALYFRHLAPKRNITSDIYHEFAHAEDQADELRFLADE